MFSENRFLLKDLKLWRVALASEGQVYSPRCSSDGGKHGQDIVARGHHMAGRVSTHWLRYLEGYLLRKRERAKVTFSVCPLYGAIH